MVNKQNFDNIKLHGTNVKKNIFFLYSWPSFFIRCVYYHSFIYNGP